MTPEGSQGGGKAQDALFATGSSSRAKYAALVVGRPGLGALLKHECVTLVAQARPGALGLLLRKFCYPWLLGACGRNVVFGQNVVLRHPHKIRIGNNVVIDDNCLLDAKGESNRGITIGSGVFVGRNTILSCKNGDIELADGANIGFNCEVFSASRVTIGAGVLMAAYSYVVGGDHDFSDPSKSVLDQQRTSKGVTIGAGGWIGAGAQILDGCTVGDHAVIGAGAVVREDVPPNAIAVGIPARVVSSLYTLTVARVAVVTSSPPATEGGHLVIARALVRALEEYGHQASLVVTPDYGFGRVAATYRANWTTEPGQVDQIITLRYPSYAVRHPLQVCWLNHAMREYYDLWPRFSASLSPLNRIKETVRREFLHAADNWLLSRNVDLLVAQSDTIRRRIAMDFDRQVDVVYPPPPQRAYRCDAYGGYILAISRLVSLKRVDLLLRALAEPVASGVRLVVVGDGPLRGELEALASALGIASRVTFAGAVDDAALLTHLAECRAVCFPPLAEDYGFVTAEAFASRKAVVTCTDSGGPAELIRPEDTGLVTAPAPAPLALALARLTDDAALAERLGSRAAEQAALMRWDATVSRLLIAR